VKYQLTHWSQTSILKLKTKSIQMDVNIGWKSICRRWRRKHKP